MAQQWKYERRPHRSVCLYIYVYMHEYYIRNVYVLCAYLVCLSSFSYRGCTTATVDGGSIRSVWSLGFRRIFLEFSFGMIFCVDAFWSWDVSNLLWFLFRDGSKGKSKLGTCLKRHIREVLINLFFWSYKTIYIQLDFSIWSIYFLLEIKRIYWIRNHNLRLSSIEERLYIFWCP